MRYLNTLISSNILKPLHVFSTAGGRDVGALEYLERSTMQSGHLDRVVVLHAFNRQPRHAVLPFTAPSLCSTSSACITVALPF